MTPGDLNFTGIDQAGDKAVAFFDHDTASGEYALLKPRNTPR